NAQEMGPHRLHVQTQRTQVDALVQPPLALKLNELSCLLLKVVLAFKQVKSSALHLSFAPAASFCGVHDVAGELSRPLRQNVAVVAVDRSAIEVSRGFVGP